MYIEREFQKPVESLLEWWLSSDASSDSQTIKLMDKISLSVLDKVGADKMTPRNLSLAMARVRANLDNSEVEDHVASVFKKETFKVLGEYHDRFEPALDPKFVSFTVSEAECVIKQLIARLGMNDLRIESSTDRDNYVFRISKCLGPRDSHSINMSLYGRNSAVPTLNDNFKISDIDGDAADFSIAKVLGFGFWKPCRNNHVASRGELSSCFYEPLAHFQKLHSLVEQSLVEG